MFPFPPEALYCASSYYLLCIELPPTADRATITSEAEGDGAQLLFIEVPHPRPRRFISYRATVYSEAEGDEAQLLFIEVPHPRPRRFISYGATPTAS